MTNYIAITGQSIYDICLQTYGTFDYLVKLMSDSGFASLEAKPYGGQIFVYDETLVANQPVTSSAQISSTIYSTAQSNRGNILTTITNEGPNSSSPTSPYVPPNNGNPNMKYYQQTAEYQFTSNADGTASINISELIGCSVIGITKEIQPLLDANWSFNSSSGTLTLIGTTVDSGQSLFILYSKIITS